MSASIDFFFFYGSTYTYLSVMRIEQAAAAAGVNVNWRPFNVRAIMLEMDNIPFATKPAKAAYMWRDLERRAAGYGLDYRGQPQYPVDPDLLANRVGVLAAKEGWCPDYTKASYRAWFLEDRPLGLDDNVEHVLRSLDKDPAAVIAAANADDNVQRLEDETDAARALGIFGSPTFAVGGEIFWGDDRLEDALAWSRR